MDDNQKLKISFTITPPDPTVYRPTHNFSKIHFSREVLSFFPIANAAFTNVKFADRNGC